MSAELTKARTLLSKVGSALKQNKLIPAVQSVREALAIILRNPLMKSEKDEFSGLMEQAVYQLSSSQNLKQIYPLIISYSPGQEKELHSQMGDILTELQNSQQEEAQGLMELLAQRKAAAIKKVEQLLSEGKFEEAKTLADRLMAENPDDADIKAEIADLFVKYEQYKEAFVYLDEALKIDPKAAHLYNRIGIVLRKMQDFETAEKYYDKAVACCTLDEYLHFNRGRLYYDWKKWDKMQLAAEQALEINPEFMEAKKMLAFARKKQG